MCGCTSSGASGLNTQRSLPGHLHTYTAELIEEGKEANTVRLRQAALRQFGKWLVDDDELPEDPLVGLKPPKIPAKVVEALTTTSSALS